MKITNQRIEELATIQRKNSSFNIPFRHQTTMNTGDLVPFISFDVMSGDTFNFDTISTFARMTTPIFPVMDSAYLDVYFFYVPYRIVYDKYKQFLGESDSDEYGIQETEYFMPSVYNITYTKYDMGRYLGLPVSDVPIPQDLSLNICKFRSYVKIFNEWFRNENSVQPYECREIYENFDYNSNVGILSDVSKLQYGKGLAKVAKLGDLFTTALPFTQKGPVVKFDFENNLPLYVDTEKFKNEYITLIDGENPNESALIFQNATPGTPYAISPSGIYEEPSSFQTYSRLMKYNLNYGNFSADTQVNLKLGNTGVTTDISFSINELRTAFQMQRFYEALARSGTRYNEIIKGIFNVDILDATVQRPQLICSKRFNINMQEVVQTSSTDSISPQGNVAGLSKGRYTANNMGSISIREPGTIMGLCCIRTNHTYTNCIPKEFRKLRKFDYYFPQFQSIGEQGIKNSEIFYSGNSNKDNDIFGYQEAWYEYRNFTSYVSGDFSQENSAYAPYTYADYFSDTPILNKDFITETDINVKRTLAVQDGPDFLVDFYCFFKASRPLPLYSIPGLIDHF